MPRSTGTSASSSPTTSAGSPIPATPISSTPDRCSSSRHLAEPRPGRSPSGGQPEAHLVGQEPPPAGEDEPVAAGMHEARDGGVGAGQGPGARAQRQLEPLHHPAGLVEALLGGDDRATAAYGRDVALGCPDVPPPAPVLVGVGRAPDAPVVALAPVQQVVAALVNGAGTVRDLVPQQTGG